MEIFKNIMEQFHAQTAYGYVQQEPFFWNAMQATEERYMCSRGSTVWRRGQDTKAWATILQNCLLAEGMDREDADELCRCCIQIYNTYVALG